jgi:hypothetical protein
MIDTQDLLFPQKDQGTNAGDCEQSVQGKHCLLVSIVNHGEQFLAALLSNHQARGRKRGSLLSPPTSKFKGSVTVIYDSPVANASSRVVFTRRLTLLQRTEKRVKRDVRARKTWRMGTE